MYIELSMVHFPFAQFHAQLHNLGSLEFHVSEHAEDWVEANFPSLEKKTTKKQKIPF